MTINKVLGVYILLDRKHHLYFSGITRAEVIEKACWSLFNLNK